MESVERGHLPVRYRLTLLSLSLLTGCLLGALATMQHTSADAVASPALWAVGAALGGLLGAVGFVALEHSLE